MKKIYERLSPRFDTPEGKLILAVIMRAISDLKLRNQKVSARRYLRGEMWPAELLDVNPDWVRRVIRECGVTI